MSRSSPGHADPVRFAIVGPGKVAELHASALARIPEARLVAVAGRDPGRTGSFAARFGARADPGLTATLRRGEVDAVVLCTPHPVHAEQAIEAADGGLAVVVEKPLALDPADADRVIAACRRNGVLLSVISQRRWYPAVQRVRAAIDDGRIGGPALATLEVLGWRGRDYYAMDPWRGTAEGEGGGVLVNQAVHQLDLLCWFLGEPVEVDGFTANINHPEIDVEDTAVAVVRFASGALATVTASNAQRPGLWGRVHVHGRNGASIGVETDSGSSFVAGMSAPSPARNDVWTIPGETERAQRWPEEDAGVVAGRDASTHFHELQLRDIVRAMRERRLPAVTGEDGRRAVALLWAVYEAQRTGGR
ncbi:MAG TPA: Gfo/Idh/MocA family oxidoreductase, partial [Candidatus Limnocylindrales bacterium]|nr:Gfo/Idh/MocA family oxidoreductase [Candidatus Limnocylindrales bacterium]